MKIFLRILGYSGIGLIIASCFIKTGFSSGLISLGIGLVIVTVTELLIKYGQFDY